MSDKYNSTANITIYEQMNIIIENIFIKLVFFIALKWKDKCFCKKV
jgi:hypothetical protein